MLFTSPIRSYYYGGDGQGATFYRDYDAKAQSNQWLLIFVQWNGRYGDRLRPGASHQQVSTYSPEMLRETRRLAERHDLPNPSFMRGSHRRNTTAFARRSR